MTSSLVLQPDVYRGHVLQKCSVVVGYKSCYVAHDPSWDVSAFHNVHRYSLCFYIKLCDMVI